MTNCRQPVCNLLSKVLNCVSLTFTNTQETVVHRRENNNRPTVKEASVKTSYKHFRFTIIWAFQSNNIWKVISPFNESRALNRKLSETSWSDKHTRLLPSVYIHTAHKCPIIAGLTGILNQWNNEYSWKTLLQQVTSTQWPAEGTLDRIWPLKYFWETMKEMIIYCWNVCLYINRWGDFQTLWVDYCGHSG